MEDDGRVGAEEGMVCFPAWVEEKLADRGPSFLSPPKLVCNVSDTGKKIKPTRETEDDTTT